MHTTAPSPTSTLVMDLLERHVPLTLLLDLAFLEGPFSATIYDVERDDHSDSRIWAAVRRPGLA